MPLTLAAACVSVEGGDVEPGATDGAVVAVEVQPFEEVQATDLAFEADPSDPTRGIFRVDTTEPMICAIVWGPDADLGRFNNSLAMNGTGIIEHDVFLPDVEAGREYHYVVQGTTADGTLYRSEMGTFTIEAVAAPPTEPGVAVGEDLTAAATVADVSSEFSSSFAAGNAIDGDPATEWSTAGDGGDAFLELDLGRSQAIGAVEFVTRTMADGTATTTTYTVSVDDGTPVGPFAAGSPARPQVAEVDLEGRRVRFDVADSTGGNVGAIEVRVFGPAG